MKEGSNLTQELVRLKFDYNPDTGILTNKVWRSNRAKRGARSGAHCNTHNRRTLTLNGYNYKEHRFIWFFVTGKFPFDKIDHINGDSSDNRWCNLREVDNKENGINAKRSIANKSGITGVFYDKTRNKYMSNIMVDGRTIFLGRFDIFELAVFARQKAELDYGFHENHGRN